MGRKGGKEGSVVIMGGAGGRHGRYKIIEVWEYRNVGMGIWDTKELDKTKQDTEGMKNEGRREERKQGRKEGRPRKEGNKV